MRVSRLIRDGAPVAELLELAAKHQLEVSPGMSPAELSEQMQGRWVRKTAHQYQVPPGPPDATDFSLLRYLGMVDEFDLVEGRFDGALVLGALVTAVRKRLALLKSVCERTEVAVEVNLVYLLGGTRPLDSVKERPAVLCSPSAEIGFKPDWVPKERQICLSTESEMMQLVFDQSLLPEGWTGVTVRTGHQPDGIGGTRVPNTEDTVRRWIATYTSNPGRYLVVSSQPFLQRQLLNVQGAARSLGLQGFEFEGIGYAAPATIPLKTYLDEVARLLFEEVRLAD